jgi:hypothetical protein
LRGTQRLRQSRLGMLLPMLLVLWLKQQKHQQRVMM